MLFKQKSGEQFTFAGLWDSWKRPDGDDLRTYTIVTTDDLIEPIHNRLPVMLSRDDALKWLAADDEIVHARGLLKHYPSEKMEGHIKMQCRERAASLTMIRHAFLRRPAKDKISGL